MNINENELVMFKNDKDNVIQSGGYKINSILKKYNINPMRSLNTNSLNNDNSNKVKKDKISSIYDDLAVPAGLLYLQDMSKKFVDNNDIVKNMNDLNKNSINVNNNELIEDSLYDKLFKLASISSNDTPVNNKSRNKYNNHKNHNKTNKINNKPNKLSDKQDKVNNKPNKLNDKNKKTKRVRFSKYNKTRRFYK